MTLNVIESKRAIGTDMDLAILETIESVIDDESQETIAPSQLRYAGDLPSLGLD